MPREEFEQRNSGPPFESSCALPILDLGVATVARRWTFQALVGVATPILKHDRVLGSVSKLRGARFQRAMQPISARWKRAPHGNRGILRQSLALSNQDCSGDYPNRQEHEPQEDMNQFDRHGRSRWNGEICPGTMWSRPLPLLSTLAPAGLDLRRLGRSNGSNRHYARRDRMFRDPRRTPVQRSLGPLVASQRQDPIHREHSAHSHTDCC